MRWRAQRPLTKQYRSSGDPASHGFSHHTLSRHSPARPAPESTISYDGLVMFDRASRERFESKFRITPGCWIWTGAKSKCGYGYATMDGVYMSAHRASYQLYKGRIEKGQHIQHSCDNRICVNPDHLTAGTRQENIQDMVNKGRQARGEKNCNAKLTAAQILEIQADTRKLVDIAKDYGVTHASISFIKSRRIWRHV